MLVPRGSLTNKHGTICWWFGWQEGGGVCGGAGRMCVLPTEDLRPDCRFAFEVHSDLNHELGVYMACNTASGGLAFEGIPPPPLV